MKIRYSYTYKRYPDCYEATCYSKRRSNFASLMAMGGFFVLIFGIICAADIFNAFFIKKYIFDAIIDVLVVSFCVYYFYYLLALHNIITENEIRVIFAKAKYGHDIPLEIYEKIELMRIENRSAIIKKLMKFSIVYILVLGAILFVGWLLLSR